MTPAPDRDSIAAPRPAATLVLIRDCVRDGARALEVLLLRRSERAAFVPGGFVFPGGVVDPEDAAVATTLVSGLSAGRAAERLDLSDGVPPALAYFVAAVRETFEETGLLVGMRGDHDGELIVDAEDVARVRAALLERRLDFGEALTQLRARVAADELEYFAHWITPERAPRRYDTRFFAARADARSEPVLDPREMTEALWTTPAAALRALDSGSLRMILPTIETLKHLATFADTDTALVAMSRCVVTTNLPDSETKGFAARPTRPRLAQS